MFCYKQLDPPLGSLKPKGICAEDIVIAHRLIRTGNSLASAGAERTWEAPSGASGSPVSKTLAHMTAPSNFYPLGESGFHTRMEEGI
jgi:hypothetical protein